MPRGDRSLRTVARQDSNVKSLAPDVHSPTGTQDCQLFEPGAPGSKEWMTCVLALTDLQVALRQWLLSLGLFLKQVLS